MVPIALQYRLRAEWRLSRPEDLSKRACGAGRRKPRPQLGPVLWTAPRPLHLRTRFGFDLWTRPVGWSSESRVSESHLSLVLRKEPRFLVVYPRFGLELRTGLLFAQGQVIRRLGDPRSGQRWPGLRWGRQEKSRA